MPQTHRKIVEYSQLNAHPAAGLLACFAAVRECAILRSVSVTPGDQCGGFRLLMVDVIVAALAAGATAGVSGTASEAVKDAYGVLKALLRRRFTGREAARAALEAEQTEPGVWQAAIGQDLQDCGAATDEQVLAAARELLSLVDPRVGATFTIGSVQGAAGQFNAPVSFDMRSQLPHHRR
ncbi:hypothetical protein [Paractinoplanes durhamensis]|uniref:hypothetical protein n=1 Tax=Paractinoplanes durhamensis TaxID=113563 RepID=UPI00362E6902